MCWQQQRTTVIFEFCQLHRRPGINSETVSQLLIEIFSQLCCCPKLEDSRIAKTVQQKAGMKQPQRSQIETPLPKLLPQRDSKTVHHLTKMAAQTASHKTEPQCNRYQKSLIKV
mmetsp:Transcript_145878/g.268998  ORF Transcript_145878/g.268998 Transcript_145878/m.268998 type:complete len:114 (+) Transcript_145878:9-350(+)